MLFRSDCFEYARQGLLTAYEEIIDSTLARRREHDLGVQTLFGSLTEDGPSFDERKPVPAVEASKRQKLAWEKEMLGLYVSDHPLMGVETMLKRKSDCSLGDLAEREEGARAVVGGVVTNLVRKWTKKGDLMAVFTLEDLTDSVECMVFPNSMKLWGHLLTEDANDQVMLVDGRIDKRDDLPKLIVGSLEMADLTAISKSPPLRLRLAPTRLDDVLLGQLRSAIADHPGESEVYFHLDHFDGEKVLRLPELFSVDTSNGLVGELRALLGADAVLL